MLIKVLTYLLSILISAREYYLTTSPGNTQRGYVSFRQVPNLQVAIIQIKEKENIPRFFKGIYISPSAITQADLDEYVNQFYAQWGMQAGFEYYRIFPPDVKDDKELIVTFKNIIPMFILWGDISSISPVILSGSNTLNSIKGLSFVINVNGIMVPLSSHLVFAYQIQFATKQLAIFLCPSNITRKERAKTK